VKRIFVGLALWNTIFLLATASLGYWASLDPVHSFDPAHRHIWHFTAGVATAIFTCLTQSIVIIHFSGSGKGIKEAIEGHAIADDPITGYARRVRRFRGRVSGIAYSAVLLMVAATLLGGWYDRRLLFHYPAGEQMLTHLLHLSVSILALVFNLYSFVKEYRLITENAALIAEVNRLIARKSAA
jgi:hypothetical protein